MKNLTTIVSLFSITLFFSCNKDSEPEMIEFDPPEITILSEQNVAINIGKTLSFSFEVNAPAGISSIEVDGQNVNFSNNNMETVSYSYEITSSAEIGPNSLRIELMDKEDRTSEEVFNFNVTDAITIFDWSSTLSGKLSDFITFELEYGFSRSLERVDITIDNEPISSTNILDEKIGDFQYIFSGKFRVPINLLISTTTEVQYNLVFEDYSFDLTGTLVVEEFEEMFIVNQSVLPSDTIQVIHSFASTIDTSQLELKIVDNEWYSNNIFKDELSLAIPIEYTPGEYALELVYADQVVQSLSLKIEDPEDYFIDGVGLVLTESEEMFAYLTSVENEEIYIKKNFEVDTLESLLFRNENGYSYIEIKDNLPYLLVEENLIAIFSNYRNDLVDIAVIEPGVNQMIYPDVEIEVIPSFPNGNNTAGRTSNDFLDQAVQEVKFSLDVISIVSCGVNVAMINAYGIVDACAGTVLTSKDWMGSPPSGFDDMLKATSITTGAISCVITALAPNPGTVLGCATFVAGQAVEIYELAEQGVFQAEEDIQEAVKNLELLQEIPCDQNLAIPIAEITGENEITLSASNGVEPYRRWKFSDLQMQNNPVFVFDELEYGLSYEIVVVDARGCTYTNDIVFDDPNCGNSILLSSYSPVWNSVSEGFDFVIPFTGCQYSLGVTTWNIIKSEVCGDTKTFEIIPHFEASSDLCESPDCPCDDPFNWNPGVLTYEFDGFKSWGNIYDDPRGVGVALVWNATIGAYDRLFLTCKYNGSIYLDISNSEIFN